MRWRRRPGIDLDGAVVVVTGASSGIGRATATALAGRGCRVVLAARNADELRAAVADCRREGGDAIAVPTDVSDPAAVAELAQAAVDRYGHIDAWVSNAGVMAYGRYDAVPAEVHQQVLATNLLGPMHAASVVLPRFRDQSRGVLVNVSSLYGVMTTPFVTAYATSKFGLIGFSRAVRRDIKGIPGVEVCCVLPSSIDTPIFRHAANYSGRRVRAIPPVASPRRVVRAIVGCLENPRAEVRVGWVGRGVALGQTTAPFVYDRTVRRAMETLGFRDEPAPETEGNVFAPASNWNQVEGEWRSTAGRALVAGIAAAGAAATLGRRGVSRPG